MAPLPHARVGSTVRNTTRLLVIGAFVSAALVAPATSVGASDASLNTADLFADTPVAQNEGEDEQSQTRDVIANLWEWNWTSVANECVNVLGPKGYAGVQVAPPQDSLSRASDATTPPHPWWEVYQPVDYNLTSRFGNEDQFKAMVATCRKAGVKVYVDAVINHMTGQGDTSYGGVHYTHFSYPDYGFADFHHRPADCPSASGGIEDFNNFLQVTECELLGLADLRTESDHVRSTIAGYLNKLISSGVSGFRVDAAKHIGQTDLAALEARLNRTADGTRPYIALEVFPGGPGKLAPAAFQSVGNLLGFDYAYQLESAFKSYTSPPGGNITDLQIFGADAGLLPSNRELVFVENHDTERDGSTLSYKDGTRNILAHEFMLARGHGRPQVYAAFNFDNRDQSPPADANGFVKDTDCSNGWTCTDRITGVANMVRWHNFVGNAPIANWFDDGVNLIAFSRGDRGWIALNNEPSTQSKTYATGLASGTYCDIIHGALQHGACSGPTYTVGGAGKVTLTVPANDAVAFSAADRIGGSDH